MVSPDAHHDHSGPDFLTLVLLLSSAPGGPAILRQDPAALSSFVLSSFCCLLLLPVSLKLISHLHARKIYSHKSLPCVKKNEVTPQATAEADSLC